MEQSRQGDGGVLVWFVTKIKHTGEVYYCGRWSEYIKYLPDCQGEWLEVIVSYQTDIKYRRLNVYSKWVAFTSHLSNYIRHPVMVAAGVRGANVLIRSKYGFSDQGHFYTGSGGAKDGARNPAITGQPLHLLRPAMVWLKMQSASALFFIYSVSYELMFVYFGSKFLISTRSNNMMTLSASRD